MAFHGDEKGVGAVAETHVPLWGRSRLEARARAHRCREFKFGREEEDEAIVTRPHVFISGRSSEFLGRKKVLLFTHSEFKRLKKKGMYYITEQMLQNKGIHCRKIRR